MSISAIFPNPPDPTSRQPFTTAAFLPLCACNYILAVLAILPHTYILRLALVPVILWQAWNCAVGLDFSAALAKSAGHDSVDKLNHHNFAYGIVVLTIVLRSLEWAFTTKPLRRYESPVDGQQHAPVERRLSIPNVLLDAFDLICNQRGIGWSWSHNPFPAPSSRSASIASVLAKLFFKFLVCDICVYLVQHLRPSVNDPAGDTIFDPSLGLVARWAFAGLYTLCAGVIIYTNVDMLYHFATLVGRVILRQPAWQWPPLSDRPWIATSIVDFWSFRWHQFFRHVFVVYGARPGGAILGRPGALLGAFGVSAVIHDLGMWGLGRGTEFHSVSGFFLLMGIGAAVEHAFKRLTGRRVGGIWGWAWTMAWTLGWGTLIIDAWARRGLVARDFSPEWFRPGKLLLNTIISHL